MQISRFSGHESFQCKSFWLKKGYDFLKSQKSFSDDAIIELGVGKNMISSIQYWLKAFNILTDKNELSDIGILLFDDEKGKDLYLEDINSLWLLHFSLVTSNYAGIYNLLFKELRKERIDFSIDDLYKFVNRFQEINENTLNTDINVLLKNYISNKNSNEIDEQMSSLLLELNVLTEFKKDDDKKNRHFQFNISGQKQLSSIIVLFGITSIFSNRTSISFEELEEEIGYVFLLDSSGLYQKIHELTTQFPAQIIYKNDAGRKEIQLKNIPSPLEILNEYYQ